MGLLTYHLLKSDFLKGDELGASCLLIEFAGHVSRLTFGRRAGSEGCEGARVDFLIDFVTAVAASVCNHQDKRLHFGDSRYYALHFD